MRSSGALWRVGELAAGVVVAAIIVAWTWTIDINPLDRTAQVSALASLQLPVLAMGLGVALLLIAGSRQSDPDVGSRLKAIAWSAVSGIFSGIVGAGTLLALRGTPMPLNGESGDAGRLILWVTGISEGNFDAMPGEYPPLVPYTAAAASRVFGVAPESALKLTLIGLTVLVGPIAYLAFRLVLKQGWALIGVVSLVPLLSPYKPYTALALAALIPVLVRVLQIIARPEEAHAARRKQTLLALGMGAAVGLIMVLYSGWFLWSAPGFAVMAIYAFVRSNDRARSLLNTAVIGVGFIVVAGVYLLRSLRAGTISDSFFYFDTETDPAYFLMWKDDLQGALTQENWPPTGEFGGVGLFMIVLLAGTICAVALGWRQTIVKLSVITIVGAWALRMIFAARMYSTQTVQLYPRTSAELVFLFFLLAGLALMYGVQRLRLSAEVMRRTSVAAACVVAALFAISGSSVANDFMPADNGTTQRLAWKSHHLDDWCSAYVAPEDCAK